MFGKKGWGKTEKGKISKQKSDKKWRENNPEYRKDNRERINKNQKKHIEKKRQYTRKYKLTHGCAICGYNKCEVLCMNCHMELHEELVEKIIERGNKEVKIENVE